MFRKNNLLKAFLFLFLVSSISTFMSGCGTTHDNPPKEPQCVFQKVDIETGLDYVDVYIDTETKVQYFVYQDSTGKAGGGAICPRYNPDGSLYMETDVSQGVVFRKIENETGLDYITAYEDVYTGVQYFVYQDSGGKAGGGGISARFGNNMKPYVVETMGETT